MQNYNNILLINFGGIGDEILFMPVIKELRTKFPNAKITLCLEGRSKSFVNLTDLLTGYFCVDIKTKNKYLQMLKLYFKALSGGYDLVISSGANPLISLLLFFTGIKTRVGYKTGALSEKLLTFAVDLNQNQYAGNMYFDLVKPITNGDFALPEINCEISEKNRNSVLIHPGVSAISIAKNITKTISPEGWADLIGKLLKRGKKVYLAGGPDDLHCIEKIRNELKNIDLSNFFDLYGKTKNIIELVELIKKSEVLVCSDSAPMHIGVATGTKTIAVFGPTDEKKLLPQNEKFIAVTNNCDCRPCLWHKRQVTCNELNCLEINSDLILDLI